MTTVGVNLLWCLPGEVGGSEEYITRALAAVPSVAPDLELVLFVLPGFADAHPDLADHHELIVAPVSGRRRSVRVVVERTWLPRRARQRGLAAIHHAGGTAPGTGGIPIVLSMHDIQYVSLPDNFSALKRLWLRHAVPVGLRRAGVVTVPSAFVRSSLTAAYGPDVQPVVVVPHGVPANFGRREAIDDEALRRRYTVPGPFVLYPAATYPHKNHEVLLDAMALLPPSSELKLVLIGGTGRAEAAVLEAIDGHGLWPRVVRTGRVPDADRDGLLHLADALVFPSRYEGFGAPVAEAFAAGIPVLASDATALPEVVGDAGLLLSPDDAAAWAAAMQRIESEPVLRASLVAAGRRRAGQLSAAGSAAALVAAYRLALAGPDDAAPRAADRTGKEAAP